MNCPKCGLKRTDPFFSSTSGTCPNCGYDFEAAGADARRPSNPIRQYFEDLKEILTKPNSFFKRMPRNGGLTQPLAFALIAHWIGAAIGFVWTSASLRSGEELLDRWGALLGNNDQIDVIRRSAPWASAHRLMMQWFWGMGSVLGDPFFTLFGILIKAFFVFLGARLLVGVMTDAPRADNAHQKPHEVTYESAVRILSYGTVASVLLAIPMAGSFVAWLYGLCLCVIGAKEVYQVRTGRALTIVLFPQVLLSIAVLGVFIILLVFGIGLFASLFAT